MKSAEVALDAGVDASAVTRALSEDGRGVGLSLMHAISASLGFDPGYVALVHARDELTAAVSATKAAQRKAGESGRAETLRIRRLRFEEQLERLEARLSWTRPFLESDRLMALALARGLQKRGLGTREVVDVSMRRVNAERRDEFLDNLRWPGARPDPLDQRRSVAEAVRRWAEAVAELSEARAQECLSTKLKPREDDKPWGVEIPASGIYDNLQSEARRIGHYDRLRPTFDRANPAWAELRAEASGDRRSFVVQKLGDKEFLRYARARTVLPGVLLEWVWAERSPASDSSMVSKGAVGDGVDIVVVLEGHCEIFSNLDMEWTDLRAADVLVLPSRRPYELMFGGGETKLLIVSLEANVDLSAVLGASTRKHLPLVSVDDYEYRPEERRKR